METPYSLKAFLQKLIDAGQNGISIKNSTIGFLDNYTIKTLIGVGLIIRDTQRNVYRFSDTIDVKSWLLEMSSKIRSLGSIFNSLKFD